MGVGGVDIRQKKKTNMSRVLMFLKKWDGGWGSI